MSHTVLPARMSIPEVLGDPCAAGIREHADALITALDQAGGLVEKFPQVEASVAQLRSALAEHAPAILHRLADAAGVPAEGESISQAAGGRHGDYRRDRSSGCWIWMRSVTPGGFPVSGRKMPGRQNVAARIYWMLEHGAIADDSLLVRTCGMRLCVNPEHGRLADRREHAAQTVGTPGSSQLVWARVREIRETLNAGVEDPAETMREFAIKFSVSETAIKQIVRNKVWHDPNYEPGFPVRCAAPGCSEVFRTTKPSRKYHSRACAKAVWTKKPQAEEWSPRRVRDAQARAAELASAEAEWSERLPREKSTSVWAVASVDQPVGEGTGTLQDLLADASAADPLVELEREIVRRALNGVTEESVDSMSEDELKALQDKLRAEGVGC